MKWGELVRARVLGLPLAGSETVTGSLHLPGSRVLHLQNKAGEAEDTCPMVNSICKGWIVSEDLLKEGRKEGMRVLISMWVFYLYSKETAPHLQVKKRRGDRSIPSVSEEAGPSQTPHP